MVDNTHGRRTRAHPHSHKSRRRRRPTRSHRDVKSRAYVWACIYKHICPIGRRACCLLFFFYFNFPIFREGEAELRPRPVPEKRIHTTFHLESIRHWFPHFHTLTHTHRRTQTRPRAAPILPPLLPQKQLSNKWPAYAAPLPFLHRALCNNALSATNNIRLSIGDVHNAEWPTKWFVGHSSWWCHDPIFCIR